MTATPRAAPPGGADPPPGTENRPEDSHPEPAPSTYNTSPQYIPDDCAYVVIVTTPSGRFRRRCFYSLHSATEAARRARAAGQPASLSLYALVRVADLAPGDAG